MFDKNEVQTWWLTTDDWKTPQYQHRWKCLWRQNCWLIGIEDLYSVKHAVRKSSLLSHRNSLNFVSCRELKDDRFADDFKRHEIVLVVQATVVHDQALGLGGELQGDVELVARGQRGKSCVSSLWKTSWSELAKFVKEWIVGAVSADLEKQWQSTF